jgi:CspA family cold shock protein
MTEGVVKFFNASKGFGFLQIEGRPDVFVHARSLRQSKFAGDPKEGDKLKFEIEDSDKGPRAVNVARV